MFCIVPLGALGFLSIPGKYRIRGNADLLDQQLALRCVALYFSEVTLFGESAGAASVGFHLLSPGSSGLFRRAVLQSASPTAPWASISHAEAWNRSLTLASLPGCPLSSAADLELCLQMADPEDIVTLQHQVFTQASLLAIPFLPLVHDNFLPDDPEVGIPSLEEKHSSIYSTTAPPPTPVWMGVMHGYEIEFVFGVPLDASLKYTQREVNMSRTIMKHWANFARTGNPSLSGAPWPLFEAESQVYVTLSTDPPQPKSKMIAQR
ncbi:hypothetical protein NHX12_008513, partial [Muraenolepis orangiensis]